MHDFSLHGICIDGELRAAASGTMIYLASRFDSLPCLPCNSGLGDIHLESTNPL